VLTSRGWAVAGGAGAFLAAGRALGLVDLFVAGTGLLVALVVATVYVRTVHTSVVATRRVQPPRVHAGGSSRVELTLVNRSGRRSAVLGVRDPFDRGARWARFLVAPLGPGEVARAAYRLPTEHRGVFDLGPLRVRLADPFGFAVTSTTAAPVTRLTVYPRIDIIAPLPTGNGQDPLAGADHPHALAGSGEDFYALRPYVRGDDLRRVHWPSTARTDELMIRQDEMPWQGRATVVVDSRSATTTTDALELVLSAAASIVTACWRRQSLLRLVTTGGFDSGFAAGHAHVDAILEHLAGAGRDSGDLLRVLATVRREGSGGLSVVTTAGAPATDLSAVSSLRSRYGTAALVLFERSAWAPDVAPVTGRPVPPGSHLVRVTTDRGFPGAWGAVFGPPPVTVTAGAAGIGVAG
jgi:uncharacterized protein (DUF58 family)